MGQADVATLIRRALLLMVELGGPPLAAALVAGLAISLVQTVTQINEATLAFVPKVIAVSGVLLLAGPYMYGLLASYAHLAFSQIVKIGGS